MEDFVTCEIAKKLKEKGFSPKYDIPTTFHVLKWLRDEKKIHICTYPTLGGSIQTYTLTFINTTMVKLEDGCYILTKKKL